MITVLLMLLTHPRPEPEMSAKIKIRRFLFGEFNREFKEASVSQRK